MIAGSTRSAVAVPAEGLVTIGGRDHYAIPDVNRMPPFLMSVVSSGDRWMFVSSSGGLSAGRRDAAGALFPYETDDRLHRVAGYVGAVAAMRVHTPEGPVVWRPLHGSAPAGIRRHLYKSVIGDAVVFEETHETLGLVFRYRWSSTDEFGFVKTATVISHRDDLVRVDVIDGVVGILPHGVGPALHRTLSNLSNAYKRSELLDDRIGLAVFSLESAVVDRAEPEEVLRASIAWSTGLESAQVTLDADAVAQFVDGGDRPAKTLVTGKPGAYLVESTFELDPDRPVDWHIVADVAIDQPGLVQLRSTIQNLTDPAAAIEAALERNTEALVRIMAPADALQHTGDAVASAHHFANVTYNVLRGGVPLEGYMISVPDLRMFIEQRNHRTARRHAAWFDGLPERIARRALLENVSALGDPHLARLCHEYLPFGFSRRHGDPSRPWNEFSIRFRDKAGRPILYYEGNWRDIFQNWEALATSFPDFLPGIVSTFVNASTADGYNPYRITRDGIDWEAPDEDDPWANIGYWGDHQIVYLLRLLEAADRHVPGELERMLGERRFTYANVPYRIAPYEDLTQDPKATIDYDEDAATATEALSRREGADGRLVWDGDAPLLVTLLEKLLVPALAKLSNFVPGGGIWMNTQRPEWNDANNALVGYGLSMVTLFELRRYLDHLRTVVTESGVSTCEISTQVATWMDAVKTVFAADRQRSAPTSPTVRRAMMDELGSAFSRYRSEIYDSGLSGFTSVTAEDVTALCETAISHLDETIIGARRDDGLYHSYNLVSFTDDGSGAEVHHLYEMLEGQVAVLESGVLAPNEQADVVDALFASAIYRADQHSFMLYPARRLPPFLEKNVIPDEIVAGNRLLQRLLDEQDRSIVVRDTNGTVRFQADLVSIEALEQALDALDDRWSGELELSREQTVEAYRDVFGHHAYTGRSGSMYGYEGIGSVYWHMVAKLLVAVQHSLVDAATDGASDAAVQRLITAYRNVRAGLGFNKTAREHGAIPIDPYSHTPGHAGAQQPGMTGLVKEEILTRRLELGVMVEAGEIRFDGILLRDDELLTEPATWTHLDVTGAEASIELPSGSLGLTVCQVPVVVARTDGPASVTVHFSDGKQQRIEGAGLGVELSADVFGRTGRVVRIDAAIERTD